MRKPDRQTIKQLLRSVAHVAALIPFVLLLLDWLWGGFGADPVREITLRTGKAAIILLLLSLAITPLKMFFGWNQLHPLRRIFGLYAFGYVVLHLLAFVWLDYGWNGAQIREAIFEKRYALVGFAAFLILLPLALTSTRWAMRKLGKRWATLHKGAYMAAVLAVLHYALLVKQVYTQPLILALLLSLLLLVRWRPLRQRIVNWRR